jgi:hypothetical protein
MKKQENQVGEEKKALKGALFNWPLMGHVRETVIP